MIRFDCHYCFVTCSTMQQLHDHECHVHSKAVSACNRLKEQLKMMRQRLMKANQENKQRPKIHTSASMICTICYERKKTLLFYPCTHSICDVCFSKIQGDRMNKKCPWCRRSIVGTMPLSKVCFNLS